MVINRKGSTKRAIIRNKLETTSITNLGDYWNPPSSKVESLANISQQIESIEKERGKKVR